MTISLLADPSFQNQSNEQKKYLAWQSELTMTILCGYIFLLL